MEGLVLLSLCLTPRTDQFREDLDVICRRTGAAPAALAQILRRHQALANWKEPGCSPGTTPSAEGWLVAASDAPVIEEKKSERLPPEEDDDAT
jgi:hypothetical protein